MTIKQIINTYDQIKAAGGTGFLISYQSDGPGCRGWRVIRLVGGREVPTDPDGPWYDYKRRVFRSGSDRWAALKDAQEWVAEQFGELGPWKRNALGNYLPERIAKAFPIRRKAGRG